MAKFDVDVGGVTYEVDAPDENTAWKWANATHQQAPAPATAEQKAQSSGLSRFGQGLRDPIDAGAQLLTKMLPDGIVQGGNRLNNWLADKTGMVGKLPEGGVDQQVREQEKSYQQARQATGQDGIDWARLGGNVLSPANLAIASKVPAAASTLGRVGAGAGGGAAFGLLSSPVTEGEFWPEKAKQTAISGVMGAAFPAVASMVKPNVRPEVAKLMSEGVTPTPGQIMGGVAQSVEDRLTSLPVLGDAISYSRKKGLDEFNKAALSRALKTTGGNVDDIGREGVASVRQQLQESYDKLLPSLSFKADKQFVNELNTVRQMASQLPDSQSKQFEKILAVQLKGKMTKPGLMSGERLKEVESELGRIARGYSNDPSFDNRQLGSAVEEVQNLIRQTLVRANPAKAEELQAINSGWANYARLRDAASRQGTEKGKFTPAQLAAAVRSQDKTVGKRAYSEGTALMQDLSDAGKNVLASKYPDSGTAGRLLMGAGALGGGAALSPAAVGAGGVAMLPYLPGGREAMAALLAKRPQSAEAMANAIRKIGPYMTPAMIQAMPGSTNSGQ